MTDFALDVRAVRAFLYVAETSSFTQAAEIMGMTQSAVSLKIQRLENGLGHKLFRRTPRHVELSPKGSAFIENARDFVSAHDKAYGSLDQRRARLVIGFSDHVAGPDLPELIARMNARDPNTLIEIRIGSSNDLLRRFDRRELDVAIVRFQKDRDDGEVLATERFSWFASPSWVQPSNTPLPVATMPEPCGVRVLAGDLLDDAGIEWAETFAGGGVSAVCAAVAAGVGVAAMANRLAPPGAIDVGKRLGLPKLPRLPIVVHSHASQGAAMSTVTELKSALRSRAIR